MKNAMRLLGIIALAAVIGFGVAGCDNGTTSSSVPPGNKLVITGVDATAQAKAAGGFLLGIYTPGTSKAEALAVAKEYFEYETITSDKAVAGASDDNGNLSGTTFTVQLFAAPSFTSNWTGTGTYDVWFFCVDKDPDVYSFSSITYVNLKKLNVSITGTTTTLDYTEFTEDGTDLLSNL